MIQFDNTYSKLPSSFYSRIEKSNEFQPTLIAFNEPLAQTLGLGNGEPEKLAHYFSATEFMPGSEPIAMGYAGHQFGHFVPQLGDGRAMLLGEVIGTDTKRYDVHLKGSGRTFYSRGGDGKSVIGPVLREYLVSEGMYALRIPTTRTLCAVRTGEMVERDDLLPGAVMTRIALAHVRVGTFEFFARRGDNENLKVLADYTIDRLYPELRGKYFEFWQAVAAKQIDLIARWMSVGFIHGVMNTDNMAISGETIDFGPCAFMDEFKFNKVFSSIDRNGRYAYGNQPQIALWNLARLAECLIPLLEGTPDDLGKTFSTELQKLYENFAGKFESRMGGKLGVLASSKELIQNWFAFLEQNELDFTLSHIDLERLLQKKPTFTSIENIPGFDAFRAAWMPLTHDKSVEQMQELNPFTIPRNHQIELAIRASEKGSDEKFFKLLKAVQNPWQRFDEVGEFQLPPEKNERVERTFCGT